MSANVVGPSFISFVVLGSDSVRGNISCVFFSFLLFFFFNLDEVPVMCSVICVVSGPFLSPLVTPSLLPFCHCQHCEVWTGRNSPSPLLLFAAPAALLRVPFFFFSPYLHQCVTNVFLRSIDLARKTSSQTVLCGTESSSSVLSLSGCVTCVHCVDKY